MNPLDLRGPEFLAFYVIAFVVMIAVAMVLRRAFRDADRALPGRAMDIGPLELAFLAGGGPRTVQTALISLARRGLIDVDRKGKLIADITPQAPLGGLEGSLLQAIRRSNGMSGRALVAQCSALLGDIEGRLVGAGLLLAAPTRALVTLLSYVVLLLVPVLGIAKVAVGLQRDRPVAFLLVVLGVSIIAAIFLGRPFRRTRQGERVLEQHAGRGAEIKGTPSDTRTEEQWMFGVAMFGPAMLVGTSFDDFNRPMRDAGGTGNGAGCGGGSGCGGGGGGGGGCGGGCGGCGG